MATFELPPGALELTEAQERLITELGTAGYAQYAAQLIQATEVALAAIASSDGTRASVLRELRKLRVHDGFLGSFAFDRYGDITPARVTILRVTGRTPPNDPLSRFLEGAVVDRLVSVPASLSG